MVLPIEAIREEHSRREKLLDTNIPLQANHAKSTLIPNETAGTSLLDLNHNVFHCLASSGAGACNIIEVKSNVVEAVWPAMKAVNVTPRTWAMRTIAGTCWWMVGVDILVRATKE
jgi:hypothetical protein